MSVLLSENPVFSFLSLTVQRCSRLAFLSSGIPDTPWMINRTGRRAYRAEVVQSDIRRFTVRVTERTGSYSREYRYQPLCTSLEKQVFPSAKAAQRAGLALTEQLATICYAWCR